MMANERSITGRSEKGINDGLDRVIAAMQRGLSTEGYLPGPIRLHRKAPLFYQRARYMSRNAERLLVYLCAYAFAAAVWPLQGIWKRELRKNSRQEGLTIYGNWNGRMLSAYGMKGGDSNLLIIDKKGVIRFFRSGAIPPDVIKEIQELLYAIGRE